MITRLLLYIRLAYARRQLARAQARVEAISERAQAFETNDRGTLTLQTMAVGVVLNDALREVGEWHFEVEHLAEELRHPLRCVR